MALVLFFGPLIDAAGLEEKRIDVSDTDSLKRFLLASHSSLLSQTFSIAVNGEIIKENTPLSEHDEVALLPPYSGG